MKKNIFLISILFIILFSINTIAQNKISKKIAPKISVSALLQGKWQSLDDKTNYLVFDKTQRREIAGSSNWDSTPYTLSSKCLNDSDKEMAIEPEKDKYISCIQDDLCWYILTINKDFLTLSFTGRGNTLKYKRVKQ